MTNGYEKYYRKNIDLSGRSNLSPISHDSNDIKQFADLFSLSRKLTRTFGFLLKIRTNKASDQVYNEASKFLIAP